MVRTQIQLTDDQANQLRELAAREGLSMAELIRQAVDLILVRRTAVSVDPWQRCKAAIGGFHSGLGDVAERHDDYFVESIATPGP